MNDKFYGGLDFSYDKAQLSIINSQKKIIYKCSNIYKDNLLKPQSWLNSFEEILIEIPYFIKANLSRLSISGTSGTLLACDYDGSCIGNSISLSDIYSDANKNLSFLNKKGFFLQSPYSGFSKALKLIELYGEDILLRHQSDWISGWILNDWTFGEDSNNIKLGWDINSGSWLDTLNKTSWKKKLPIIIKTGEYLGEIHNPIAKKFNINENLILISGTTNSNAAMVGLETNYEDGLTIMGQTTNLKKYLKKPNLSKEIAISRVNGKWLCSREPSLGYMSMLKIFSDEQIEELSRQINPRKRTNINIFKSDSKITETRSIDILFEEKILEKRPVSDALFLHAFMEGLAKIELNGWEEIKKISGSLPKKIFTIGKGSQNSQFRSIREKVIKIPILNCDENPSYGSALIALNANLKKIL